MTALQNGMTFGMENIQADSVMLIEFLMFMLFDIFYKETFGLIMPKRKQMPFFCWQPMFLASNQ